MIIPNCDPMVAAPAETGEVSVPREFVSVGFGSPVSADLASCAFVSTVWISIGSSVPRPCRPSPARRSVRNPLSSKLPDQLLFKLAEALVVEFVLSVTSSFWVIDEGNDGHELGMVLRAHFV